MEKFVLDPESTSTRVKVDGKVLVKGGNPVELTKDQEKRVREIDGVILNDAPSEGSGD